MSNIETVAGEEIEITFDPSRCIHARFCVLQAPDVFLADTPGDWIRPDAMDPAALAAVARNCPSGAITYRAVDPALDETDPPVNTVRVRENGPYAVNARIDLQGEDGPSRRRVLCRCGASRSKPYCDGSHAEIRFKATGEPPTQLMTPLAPRDGTVCIRALPDGPLEFTGPVEWVSGTGRTFAKSTRQLICRCGGSKSKPFCDGTHSLNGFSDAPGPSRPAIMDLPTLAEAAGGRAALRRLTKAFYDKVAQDHVLGPLFADMSLEHAQHVADFIAEVFGEGPVYSTEGGSHLGMIGRHLGKGITEAQRAYWVQMMLETADEIGFPDDAAFRTAFAAYLDWGSRLAVINSQPGVTLPEGNWPMPKWGWGAIQGPDQV
ncbi:CDGSH iron-sulfur domain-containing protein [Sulfitobacter sp. LCG007]